MSQLNITSKSAQRLKRWAVYLRVALGIILIWKAVNFLRDTAILQFVAGEDHKGLLTNTDITIILIISAITVISGFLIIGGFFTRMAALIQLPVFAFGTFFIHGGYIERVGFELIITLIIPFLLLLFASKGNQAFSNDPNSRKEYEDHLNNGMNYEDPSIMRKRNRFNFTDRFRSQRFYGIVILVTGMIIALLSSNSSRVIQYVAGTGMFLASIFALITAFNTKGVIIPKKYNGFHGLGMMAYALIVFVFASTFEQFIGVTVIFLLYVGITELLFGFQLMAYKIQTSMLVKLFRMIPGLLMTIGSVVILIMASLDKSSSLLIAGIIVAFSGINFIWFAKVTKKLGQPY